MLSWEKVSTAFACSTILTVNQFNVQIISLPAEETEAWSDHMESVNLGLLTTGVGLFACQGPPPKKVGWPVSCEKKLQEPDHLRQWNESEGTWMWRLSVRKISSSKDSSWPALYFIVSQTGGSGVRFILKTYLLCLHSSLKCVHLLCMFKKMKCFLSHILTQTQIVSISSKLESLMTQNPCFQGSFELELCIRCLFQWGTCSTVLGLLAFWPSWLLTLHIWIYTRSL